MLHENLLTTTLLEGMSGTSLVPPFGDIEWASVHIPFFRFL
jgi:hypothetical protein